MAVFGAVAQEFPARPVKITVPYPPGGGVDVLARQLAERLGVQWKQAVIVENRPGASTIIGTEAVVRSAPDGHNLLFTTDATVTSNPHLFVKLPFSPMHDLAPITQLASFDLMIVVNSSVPAKNFQELIAYAKSASQPLTYASFGEGSQAHIFYESLASKFGLKLSQIPYKGIAPSLQAVVSGEVQMALIGAGSSSEFVKSGKLRALAIARVTRSPLLPDVPTMAELGLKEIDPQPWFGLFAPAATPLAIRKKIWADISKVLADPINTDRMMTARGYELKLSSPEQFATYLPIDYVLHRNQIEMSGVKPQ